MAAIPTIYKGVQFRSRLEARWAALFDLMGWRWLYEPEDLVGWIPDFILYGADHRQFLVEVKPVWYFADMADDSAVLEKYQRAKDHRPLILLGLGPEYFGAEGRKLTFPALIARPNDVARSMTLIQWPVERQGVLVRTFGLSAFPTDEELARNEWIEELSGTRIPGDIFPQTRVHGPQCEALWSQAGNATQWKGPQARS